MSTPSSSIEPPDGGRDVAGDHDASRQRWRVLIVDDDPDDRMNLRQMLLRGSERHYLFAEADRGDTAVQMVRDAQVEHGDPRPFDCIILDFRLPDMNALEVLSALRGSNPLPPCPTIVITGWEGISRQDGARLLQAGAQDYIGKKWTSAESLNRSMENSIERFELVTAQHRVASALRESEERYRNLFDSLNECLCVVEKVESGELVDFRYVEVNPAFLRQSNISGEIGRTLRELSPDESEELFARCDRVCMTGVPMRFERSALAGDRVLELYAFRLGGAESRRVAIIVSDVTERKQSELRLRAQADALADADRRKDEFLAMLGHELRNPLAPLLSAVQVLQMQPRDALPHGPALRIVERQVGQLVRLLDDLLDVSRITTGKLRLRVARCSIAEIVERAVETTASLVVRRAHSLVVTVPEPDLYLEADAARLEQVVVNLLNNAVKYSDVGSKIELSVEPDGDMVVLHVRDNGIGIPPALLPRVFDLFSQAEQSLDRSEGGLGVGLSLAQRLVELHRGTIEVSSTIGLGTDFIVRLPMTAEHVEQPGQPASPGVDVAGVERRLQILIVDDNIDAAESLGMLLNLEGHEVWLAHDGEEALAVALAHPPHVVLLDIGLPRLDGYEVARRLRQQAGLSDVVIVGITGYGLARDRDMSRNAGFDHHLLKPTDISVVRKILAGLVP